MKRFFRLGWQVSLKLVQHIQSILRVNPRVFLTVGISIVAPFSGQSLDLSARQTETASSILVDQTTAKPKAKLPAVQYKTIPKHTLVGTIFAYSSTPGQTDANPTVTASGLNVADGTLATNCLPFGTKVRFPSLYGNKEFTVTDRMAARHSCSSFDIWHESTAEAKQFGRQVALVEVY